MFCVLSKCLPHLKLHIVCLIFFQNKEHNTGVIMLAVVYQLSFNGKNAYECLYFIWNSLFIFTLFILNKKQSICVWTGTQIDCFLLRMNSVKINKLFQMKYKHSYAFFPLNDNWYTTANIITPVLCSLFWKNIKHTICNFRCGKHFDSTQNMNTNLHSSWKTTKSYWLKLWDYKIKISFHQTHDFHLDKSKIVHEWNKFLLYVSNPPLNFSTSLIQSSQRERKCFISCDTMRLYLITWNQYMSSFFTKCD
jgi:hypothetical protein